MADQPNNIFSDAPEVKPTTQEVKQEQQVAQTNNQLVDMLKEIKNEQGAQKYDSVEKALEGLLHAQNYIPQLKSELEKEREELNKLKAELGQRGSLEEVVERLTAKQREAQGKEQPTVPSGLDEQAVLQLVQKSLSQAKEQESAVANQARVQQALQSKFGEKTREEVERRANELGTTPQELGALASKNPQMVLALFNAAQQASVKPTTGSVHLPDTYRKQAAPELEKPSKSLLAGASMKDQAEYMRQVKASVYARHNIET